MFAWTKYRQEAKRSSKVLLDYLDLCGVFAGRPANAEGQILSGNLFVYTTAILLWSVSSERWPEKAVIRMMEHLLRRAE